MTSVLLFAWPYIGMVLLLDLSGSWREVGDPRTCGQQHCFKYLPLILVRRPVV